MEEERRMEREEERSERERGGREKRNGRRIGKGRRKQWGREREWDRGRERNGERMEKGERKKENREPEPRILWGQLERFVCLLIDWLIFKVCFLLQRDVSKSRDSFSIRKNPGKYYQKKTLFSQLSGQFEFKILWILYDCLKFGVLIWTYDCSLGSCSHAKETGTSYNKKLKRNKNATCTKLGFVLITEEPLSINNLQHLNSSLTKGLLILRTVIFVKNERGILSVDVKFRVKH